MSVIRRLYENGTITICPADKSRGCPPGHKGNKKTYKLDHRRKRLIECSAIRLWYLKKNSLKFGTLTFTCTVDHQEANKCLSKFLENCKKTYKLNSYVVVKELHKSGNPHYHFLFDIPFVNFKLLNRAWCSACAGIMRPSSNAFTTGTKVIIKDIQSVINYISKYITKASEIELSKTKNYFIDHNTLSTGKLITYNEYIYLTTKFQSKTVVKENFTIVYLKKFHYLPERILVSFKTKIKKPDKIPDSLPYNFDFYLKIPEKSYSIHDFRM